MQVVISDEANGLTVCVTGPEEGYNPEIVRDLAARALEAYTQGMVTRISIARTTGGHDEH